MSFSWSTRGHSAALGMVLSVVAAVTLLAPSNAFAEKLVSDDGRFVVYTPDPWQLQPLFEGTHPVILYLHGARHKYETAYEPLLEDLASRNSGSYVIFPRYDATHPDTQSQYFLLRALFGAAGALYDANDLLAQHGYASIDTEHITIAGHSVGAAYALVLANAFSSVGTITPEAIVLHDPSGYKADSFPAGQFPELLNDLSSIPRQTRLTLVVSRSTFDPEFWSFVFLSPTRGQSQFSGIWTSAWRNTNIGADRKSAEVVEGPHQGMLNLGTTDTNFYPTFGAPYRDATLAAAADLPYGLWGPFFEVVLPQ
jgi:hypothetical protein